MNSQPTTIPVTHNIHQHSHPTRQMPHDMAMKQPDTRIISLEAKDRVSATGDLDCVSQDGFGEIVGEFFVCSSSRIIGIGTAATARS